VMTENDPVFTDLTAFNARGPAFAPFQPSQDLRPTLYLGFVLPAGRATFRNTSVTMFFRTVPVVPEINGRVAEIRAEARHAGRANVVFLDAHVEALSLGALGYVLVNGIQQFQITSAPLPGANNALWTGRGLDEFSPGYAIDGP